MATTSSNRAGPPASPATVDTRTSGGPDGRLYTASFAVVWDQVLEEIRARGRWELVHHDEELGLITVRCRGFLSSGASLLTVWVGLDDNGLTRLDLRSVPETRRGLSSGERRIRELLGRLDQTLGAGARVKT